MNKRWFLKDSLKAKIGIAFIALALCAGALASRPTPVKYETQMSARAAESSSAAAANTPITATEKSKIDTTRTEIVTKEEEVPFTTTQTYDGTLPKDTSVVRVEGRPGKKIVRTEVKTENGVEVSRSLISEQVTVPPVAKIVAIGTKVTADTKKDQKWFCDPNYKPCVPKIRRDLDCDDINMKVQIIGDDIHRLDDNGDGVACEHFDSDF